VPDQASIVRGCLPIHRVLFAAIDLRLWVWDGNWFGDGIIFFWWGLFFLLVVVQITVRIADDRA